jgi:hypothetical protein
VDQLFFLFRFFAAFSRIFQCFAWTFFFIDVKGQDLYLLKSGYCPTVLGANGSESQKTALKVLTSCLMPHSFIVEAKPLECGSAPEVRRAAAAFTAIANTGIRPKAAAALPHSKAPFGRSLAFDSHFRLHPTVLNHLSFASRFGSLNFVALNDKDRGKSQFANERTEPF